MAKLPTYNEHLLAVAWRNKVPVSVAKWLTPIRADQWNKFALSQQMKRWNRERRLGTKTWKAGRRSNKTIREQWGPYQQGTLGLAEKLLGQQWD